MIYTLLHYTVVLVDNYSQKLISQNLPAEVEEDVEAEAI